MAATDIRDDYPLTHAEANRGACVEGCRHRICEERREMRGALDEINRLRRDVDWYRMQVERLRGAA